MSGDLLKEDLNTERSILDCKFTIYSPNHFRDIIDSAWQKVNLRYSLDVNLNEEKIKKAGESGGGASGELFMFTHDSKLILKTATLSDVKVFQEILTSYKDHFKSNKRS